MSAVIFRNASILDVVRGELRPDHEVLVIEDRIQEVGTGKITFPEARVVDVEGRVLMPGLCDAHVHAIAATADFAALERWSPSYVAAHASQILRAMLFRGFTTVRDAGGADQGLARALSEKLWVGPRLLYGGKALSQTGGHGDMRQAGERAVPCPCCSGLARICDGVSEVRRACRDVVRSGGTHIKLMVSGGVSSPTDRISSTQFSDEELAAAVEEARAAEIYCMAHAYTPRAIRRAVLAGVKSIEHGNLLDQDTVAVLREKNAFLVPTLVTYDALAREGAEAGLPAAARAKLGEVLRSGIESLELAARSDVSVVFGTDLLGSMHRHQLTEFVIRGEVQKPIDVIRSATVTAARLFNMEGQIGVVAAGAFADLLVIDGNPLENLGVLTNPARHLHAIMRQGEFVHCKE